MPETHPTSSNRFQETQWTTLSRRFSSRMCEHSTEASLRWLTFCIETKGKCETAQKSWLRIKKKYLPVRFLPDFVHERKDWRGKKGLLREGNVKRKMRLQTQFHFVPAPSAEWEWTGSCSSQRTSPDTLHPPSSSPSSLLCLYSVSFVSAASGFYHEINLSGWHIYPSEGLQVLFTFSFSHFILKVV